MCTRWGNERRVGPSNLVSIPHQAGGAEVNLGQMTDSKFCFLGGATGCPLTTTLCQRPQMVYSCPSGPPCNSSPKKSQRYSQSVNLNSVTSSNDSTVFRIKTKLPYIMAYSVSYRVPDVSHVTPSHTSSCLSPLGHTGFPESFPTRAFACDVPLARLLFPFPFAF